VVYFGYVFFCPVISYFGHYMVPFIFIIKDVNALNVVLKFRWQTIGVIKIRRNP
jgi:hypothetical protein